MSDPIPVPEDVPVPPGLSQAQEQPKQQAITAFLVIIDVEGRAMATGEIERGLGTFDLRREADLEDIRRACAEVANGVERILAAQTVMNVQMDMVQQAQRAKAGAALLGPEGQLLLPGKRA